MFKINVSTLTFLTVCLIFPFTLFNGSNCTVVADVYVRNSQYVRTEQQLSVVLIQTTIQGYRAQSSCKKYSLTSRETYLSAFKCQKKAELLRSTTIHWGVDDCSTHSKIKRLWRQRAELVYHDVPRHIIYLAHYTGEK